MKKTRFVFLFLAVLPLVTFLGCSLLFDSSNGDAVPPPVVAIDPEPSQDDPVVQTAASDPAEYTLQLDGNAAAAGVRFRAIEMPPPEDFNIVVDESTGIVTVGTTVGNLLPNTLRSATVEFYSSFNVNSADDGHGGSTIDRPYTVTFYIKGPPEE